MLTRVFHQVNQTVEKSVQEFQKETQAALIATDKAYAHDLDIIAKRKEIRLQMQLTSVGLGVSSSSSNAEKHPDDEVGAEQLMESELMKGISFGENESTYMYLVYIVYYSIVLYYTYVHTYVHYITSYHWNISVCNKLSHCIHI